MITIDQLLSSAVIHRVGWTIVHFLWQGTILGGLLALMFFFLRKRSAGMRYLAGCLAMLLLAACPIVTFYLTPQPTVISIRPVSETVVAVQSAAALPIPPSPQVALPPADPVVSTAPPPKPLWHDRLIESCERRLPGIVIAWLIGVSILSVHLLAGVYAAHRIKRSALTPLEGHWKQKLDHLADRFIFVGRSNSSNPRSPGFRSS
jgi:hypothetical protein